MRHFGLLESDHDDKHRCCATDDSQVVFILIHNTILDFSFVVAECVATQAVNVFVVDVGMTVILYSLDLPPKYILCSRNLSISLSSRRLESQTLLSRLEFSRNRNGRRGES